MYTQLKRVITPLDIAFNAVNNTIGGGIFILPAAVAAILGPSSIYAYLLCACNIILVLLCFAHQGSNTEESGGAYIYVKNSFGDSPAFIISILSWFGAGVLADSAIANVLADILSRFMPAFQLSSTRSILFAIIFGGYAYMNIRGVRNGANIVKVNTLFKLIPLALLIFLGFFFVEFENYHGIEDLPSLKSLGEASLILFFAFQGSEAALNLGGEMQNPSKTAPKGILIGVVIIVIIYIAVQLIAQGLLGNQLSAQKKEPLTKAASLFLGNAGSYLITFGVLWSIFSNLGSSPLLFPRIIYASALNKKLPSVLSKIHPKHGTPYFAIVFYALTCFILATSGGFRKLALLSSSAMLIIYFMVCLACFKSLWKMERSNFKMPFGIWVPTLAIISIIYFLSNLSWEDIRFTLIFISIILIYYITNKLIIVRETNKTPPKD